MENADASMTEKESFLLITSMINKARNRYSESGMLYRLWGWLIFICCVIQFVGLYFFHNPKVYYAWYSTWALFLYQVYYVWSGKAKGKVRMYTGEIIMYVWIVFIISYALIVYILLMAKAADAISPMILMSFGMPTFLSGVILKFKPLKVGGIFCWVLAAIAIFVTYDFQFLLMAAAVAVAWIIPGQLLHQKHKREQNGI